MTTVARLSPAIPIGRLPDGTPVTIDPSYYRLINGQIFDRVGGTVAPTTGDVDELLQFDVREADSGELGKRIDALQELVNLSPSPEPLISQLRQLIADLQEIADSLSAPQVARTAELSKRCAGIEELQAFTK